MSNLKNVTVDTFDSSVLQSDKPVLVDFWAAWCGPCKMMGPVLEKLAQEYDNIEVVKVDVDENPQLAQEAGIVSIPTLNLYVNGQVVTKVIGAVPKAKLVKELENYI